MVITPNHTHFNMARMVLFLQMFDTRRAIRRERVFRDHTNPFDSLEDTELYSRYRFRRNELLEMVHEIKPEIEHRTRRNEAVSAENQFLTALRFYATGAFQELVGDSQGIHKSTVSRIISRVSSVLAKKLPKYVQFPVDDEELKSTMDACYAIAEFPGVIGCIDGTQIPQSTSIPAACLILVEVVTLTLSIAFSIPTTEGESFPYMSSMMSLYGDI